MNTIDLKINEYNRIKIEDYVTLDYVKDKIGKSFYKVEENIKYIKEQIKRLVNLNFREELYNLFTKNDIVFIFKKMIDKKEIKDIDNKNDYIRDYRKSEELVVNLLITHIQECLTILDFKLKNHPIYFNKNATHTTNQIVNAEADFVNKNGDKIELQTVNYTPKELILKETKFNNLLENDSFLLTKDIKANKYYILQINKNTEYIKLTTENINNFKEYKQKFIMFGSKNLIVIKTKNIIKIDI